MRDIVKYVGEGAFGRALAHIGERLEDIGNDDDVSHARQVARAIMVREDLKWLIANADVVYFVVFLGDPEDQVIVGTSCESARILS